MIRGYIFCLLFILAVAVGCGTEPSPTPSMLTNSVNLSEDLEINGNESMEFEVPKNGSPTEAAPTSIDSENKSGNGINTTTGHDSHIPINNSSGVKTDPRSSGQRMQPELSTTQAIGDEVKKMDTSNNKSNDTLVESHVLDEKEEPTVENSSYGNADPLFLTLESPDTLELIVKEPYLLIEGITRLDALVTVGVDVVEPDVNGRFTHKKQLNNDHNVIEVLASTSSGEIQSVIIAAIYAPER